MLKKKKKSWGGWIFLLVVIVGGIGAYIWYQKHPKAEPISYKTAKIDRRDITQFVTANGQITPVKNVQVGSQISGIIQDIKVDFNSRVKEGEVIAQIDPQSYQQSVTLAQADLANAKAALELAQVNYERADQLVKSSLISRSDFDKAKGDLHQNEAMVQMKEATLNRAKVDLERTTIYAPISGVVISRNVDVGQTVAASFSTPTLFLIANDLSKMQIETMVSEADVGGIVEGQKVKFTVEAYPGRPFLGVVKQVRFAPTTNQNVVTYTTVVEVDNSDLKLRPGMTATASIITSEKTNVLAVPNAAYRFRPQETVQAGGGTNGPAKKAGTNSPAFTSTSGGGGPNRGGGGEGRSGGMQAGDGGGPGGGPGGPGGPGGLSREEMRKRFESMSPEERAAARERFRAMRGGQGGGGGRPPGMEGPTTRTVYTVEKAADGTEKPKALTIKTGIGDGTYTEVISGLKEDDVVITGLNISDSQAAGGPGGQRPGGFGGGFGGGFRR